MDILTNLLTKVKTVEAGLQDGSIIRDVVTNYPDEIIQLQLEQLFEGKDSDGNDLRPYYSEDLQPGGYFKTIEAAKRYADWKQTLSYPMKGKTDRNPDAPNLYINGRFHSELETMFGTDAVGVWSRSPYALGIMAKYGREKFGLSSENWRELFTNFGALNDLITKIKELL